MRENDILKGEQGALKRALYKSMGFTGEQLGKPIIAIANSYTNATPGHFYCKQLHQCDAGAFCIETAVRERKGGDYQGRRNAHGVLHGGSLRRYCGRP